MTCCKLGICTSWPHCGSACGWKGYHYLQMSSDTCHKIIAQPSSQITSYPLRISAPTAVNHSWNRGANLTFPFTNIRILDTFNWARLRLRKTPLLRFSYDYTSQDLDWEQFWVKYQKEMYKNVFFCDRYHTNYFRSMEYRAKEEINARVVLGVPLKMQHNATLSLEKSLHWNFWIQPFW